MTDETIRHVLAHFLGLNEVIATPTKRYCTGCMWVRFR